MAVGAIAALPVLPTLFSTASAETRRADQAASDTTSSAYEASSHSEGQTGAAAPVLPERQIAPTLPADPSNAAAAPVRISDLAPAKSDGEQDGPACRAGDPASTDSNQGLSKPGEGQDTSSAGQKGPQDQGAPLPHCSIEFDPDADDPEVIAHAPKASTTPTKAAAAQTAATIEAAAKQAEKVPAADAAQAEAAAAAASSTAETAAAIAVATSASPPASEAPLLVTDATKGVGSAVIDPNLPTDSVVFPSDLPPVTTEIATATTTDTAAQPLSLDPLYDHLLIG